MDFEHIRAHVNQGSAIRAMFQRAQQFRAEGKNPIDLSLGNPDIKPPEEYYQALEEVIREARQSPTNLHKYPPTQGLPQARERIAQDLPAEWRVNKELILMTTGAATGINVALAPLAHPNQKNNVVVIAPYFVEYKNYARNNGMDLKVSKSNAKHEPNFADLDKKINLYTRAVILNSPNNPTGKIYSKRTLEQLATLLQDKRRKFGKPIVVIEDAVYSNLSFDGHDVASMMDHYPHTIHTSSFSKSLGLAGERIGYIALNPGICWHPEELMQSMGIHLRTRVVNAPVLQQRIIAKLGLDAKVNVCQYEDRTRALGESLKNAGFRFHPPEGGFYIWAKIPQTFSDEDEFCQTAHQGNDPLLYTPGFAFGDKSNKYLRLSTCVPMEEIERAGNKLRQICEPRQKTI